MVEVTDGDDEQEWERKGGADVEREVNDGDGVERRLLALACSDRPEGFG